MAIKSPHLIRASEKPQMPPVAPETESPPNSSLQVRTIIEPEANNDKKSRINYYSESEFGSSSDSRLEDFLLTMCVPVSELLSDSGSNSITTPTPLRGIAPPDSDSGFEIALDMCNLENDKVRKRLEVLMKNMASKDMRQEQIQEENHLYCQPCNTLVKGGQQMNIKLNNARVENIRKDTALTQGHKVSKVVPVKETRKGVKVLKKVDKSKMNKYRCKGVIRSTTKLGDTLRSNKKSFKNVLFYRKSQKIKLKNLDKSSRFRKLMSKKFHKKQNTRKKVKNEGVHQTTTLVTQKRSGTDDQVKDGRWKCVTDAKTGKDYFYHTGTREVSWEKPSGFVEWRVTVDLVTEKTCFVNRITKEATWVKPEGVQEWIEINETLLSRKSQKIKQKNLNESSRFRKLINIRFHKKQNTGEKVKNEGVQQSTSSVTQKRLNKNGNVGDWRWNCATDAKTGKVYFYHVGTREVSWEKPEGFVEWRVTEDLLTGKTCFVDRITKKATWVKPKGVQEWNEVNDATTELCLLTTINYCQ